ncbi:MAG: hypothetical protein ACKOX7_09270 [Bacteroidota bacterium]
MKRVLIIISILTLTYANSFGQTDTSKSNTTVVYFGDGSSTAEENSNKKYDASAVKLGVFSLVSGLYGLNYEREFSDLFAVEVGTGLTGRNWVYGLLAGEEGFGSKPQTSEYFDETLDIYDNDYDYAARESKVGFFLTATPKFYYADEDGMDGSYLGFNIQYRRYNYTAYGEVATSDPADITSSDKDIKEFENQTILALRWGYQNMNDKTIIDYFVGIGARNYKGERRDIGSVDTPNGSIYTIAPEPRNNKGTRLFFEVGMNIGLWWDKK